MDDDGLPNEILGSVYPPGSNGELSASTDSTPATPGIQRYLYRLLLAVSAVVGKGPSSKSNFPLTIRHRLLILVNNKGLTAGFDYPLFLELMILVRLFQQAIEISIWPGLASLPLSLRFLAYLIPTLDNIFIVIDVVFIIGIVDGVWSCLSPM
jgi:hypothetical protein